MDGIAILNTYQTYSDGWILILIMSIVAAVICFLVFCSFLVEDLMISGLSICLCIVFIFTCLQIPKTITCHQIIVENFAAWKELTKNYKTIRIRGQIITVEELSEKGR